MFSRVVLTLALLSALSQAVAGQTTWNRVSSFQHRFDNQDRAVVFVLEVPSPWKGNGDFARIRIRVTGQREFVLASEDGWAEYAEQETQLTNKLRKSIKNLVRSTYVLMAKAAENRTFLFLFGHVYGSSPGSLDVLELGLEGRPRVVLHRNELGLEDVRDLDGDGVAEVVGYPCLSESYGEGFQTYNPFHVFKLGPTATSRASLSLSLSKAYNLRHYYGWVGPDCSEDIVVVLHPPNRKKPIIVPLKQAEKMMGAKR